MSTMSVRERKLAGATAALVVLLGLFMVYMQVDGMFEVRRMQLAGVRKQFSEQQSTLRAERRKQRELEQRIQSTLSSDSSKARTNYKNWLVGLVKDTGMETPKVNWTNSILRSSEFQAMGFTIKSRARLDQLVQFLVAFYSTPEQHLIQNLRVTPIPDSRELDVDVSIYVLGAKGGEREAVATAELTPEQQQELEQTSQAILARNAFSEENLPPRIRRLGPQEVYAGDPIEVKVAATDPNQGDELSYTLLDGPEGARVNAADGTLRWATQQPGEYSARLLVEDNGTPRKSSEVQVQMIVYERQQQQTVQQEEPGVNDAEFAFVVATTSRDDDPEVWVNVRSTGKLLKLRIGDTLRVGSFRGEVAQISNRNVTLATREGRWRVGLGQPLTAGQLIEETVETSIPAGPDSSAAEPQPSQAPQDLVADSESEKGQL